jgi:hypothetical protein
MTLLNRKNGFILLIGLNLIDLNLIMSSSLLAENFLQDIERAVYNKFIAILYLFL